MAQKSRKIIWILGLAVLILGIRGCRDMFPYHGTANSILELQKVFHRGGAPFVAAYTNSLILNFPFKNSLSWTLLVFRNPSVSLSGGVDTNKLSEFVRANPAVRFSWSGRASSGVMVGASENLPSAIDDTIEGKVTWERVTFQFVQPVGKDSVIFVGQADLNSQVGEVSAHVSEYLNEQ